MISKGRPRVDELIQSISLHTPFPLLFHGTIFPFLFLYGFWLYSWVFVYGVEEYYEAGLVTLIGIAFVQIFTCLCCFWSVHFRAFTSCRKVSWNFFPYDSHLDDKNSTLRANHRRRLYSPRSCPPRTMDRASW